MKKRILGLAALSVMFAAPVAASTLTNEDIVLLLGAGLGEEAVIAKIEAEDGEYATDVDTLLNLRSQGVPSTVIAAMVKKESALPSLSDNHPDPLRPHYAGVYLMSDWGAEPRMLKIDPTASTQVKTGGILGYALTSGIASASIKAVFPGDEARVSAPSRRPTFYVYMDNSAGNQPGVFTTVNGISVQSPNEFSLMRLTDKKNRREVRVGSMNLAGAKAGVMDKDQIPFSYEQLAPGVFKVTPDVNLEAGHYGFVYAVTGGANGTGGARVFDFDIK